MATIMVIDDEPDVLSLLRLLLTGAGYTVMAASSGPDALAQLQERLPDLVVCDVLMPKVDGLSVLATIRADARTHHLPVLMLSAQAQAPSVQRALDAGASGYVVKPFQRRQLLNEIQRHLHTEETKPC